MQSTLKDIINFVQSRTDMVSRDDILREINIAWQEIYNSDDLPNSVFEISVKPLDATARISLPYFVDKIRAVKANNGRLRVELNTPRPYYQDEQYYQSPYTWRILGQSPLLVSITNATQIKFTIPQPADKRFTVTVIGPDDNATEVRERIVFNIGDTEHWTNRRYLDANSITKDELLDYNVTISGANGEDFGIIPNLFYQALNTIVQISDKCLTNCTSCRCFDILFKKPAPILYYDEQNVPYPEVIMTKTMEWIMLPKDGQEKRTEMFATKSGALLSNYNNDDRSVVKKIDLERNLFTSYTGGTTSQGKI